MTTSHVVRSAILEAVASIDATMPNSQSGPRSRRQLAQMKKALTEYLLFLDDAQEPQRLPALWLTRAITDSWPLPDTLGDKISTAERLFQRFISANGLDRR